MKIRFRISTLVILSLLISFILAKWNYDLQREAAIEEGVRLVAAVNRDSDRQLDLIRAVNHLHDLGHKDAITALRRYTATHPYDFSNDPLELVVAATFVPIIEGSKLPGMHGDVDPYILNRQSWQAEEYIQWCGDIPFDDRATTIGIKGLPSRHHPIYLILWAEKEAKLRGSKLQPVDDPFSAAAIAAENYGDRRITEEQDLGFEMDSEEMQNLRLWLQERVPHRFRLQVYKFVSHLVPDFTPPESGNWYRENAKWEELSSRCKSSGIHWDPRRQQYEFSK